MVQVNGDFIGDSEWCRMEYGGTPTWSCECGVSNTLMKWWLQSGEWWRAVVLSEPTQLGRPWGYCWGTVAQWEVLAHPPPLHFPLYLYCSKEYSPILTTAVLIII